MLLAVQGVRILPSLLFPSPVTPVLDYSFLEVPSELGPVLRETMSPADKWTLSSGKSSSL